MKKLLPIVFSIVAATALAQAPEAFSYQAVARDANGDPLAGTTITVVFALHQTTPTGTVLYVEQHNPTTNDLGLFQVEVGQGTPLQGTFSAINWGAGPYFLEVGIDPAGGLLVVPVGTQQLLSVPYALHAGTVDVADDGDWVVNGDTLHSGNKRVGIGTAAPDTTLHVAGGFKYQDGTQADKRILTSDADGNASWQVPDAGMLLGGFSPPFNLDCLAASATRPTGSSPRAVVQYGQYLYVANQGSNSMQVFDVSEPLDPTLVTTVPTISPLCITISGERAFVVNWGDANLSVFDLGTPASPVFLGSVATDFDPRSVAVSGDYAYVSHGFGNLWVYDVSDPSSMSLLGSFPVPGMPTSSLAIKGDHLYWVTASVSIVFDISNPASPQVVTSPSWGGDHVTRSGDHLYVASTFTDELIVVDVSNAAVPVVVATVPAGSYPRSVAVAGNNAFLVSYSSNELIVFDVSDPASPLPRGSAATGQPGSVTSDGEHAYVVSLFQDLLTAFQVFCSQGLAVDLGSGQVVFEDPIWEKNGPHISSTNFGNVGIGTTTPGFRLTTKYDTGLGNTVPNSGTADAQCGFRLTAGVVGLDMGVLQNGTSYLQNRNINNFATSYGLVLNPTGGNVGIGTTSPSEKLEVAGTVKATTVVANNILSVAALHAGLTNAGAYTGSSTTNEWALEWGSIYQNTNPAVFNLTSGGQIVNILKDGVIEVDAQFDFIRNTSGYTRIKIKVNGTTLTQSLATSSGDWQQVHAHLTWQVQAGDQVQVTAIRNEIDQMDNGTWSTLSIKWTGVND
ncbi:MAG TPA: hypothetical protein PLL57_14125 [Flavobacteriales bacterium]|nr:hypothetical protein [Flavobacteriales bacterium]HRW91110.1 hypothetical protein [Flavobacteriales bacterium]